MGQFSEEQIEELRQDIIELKNTYPYIKGEWFNDLVELDREHSK
jgi:hypothetical protein